MKLFGDAYYVPGHTPRRTAESRLEEIKINLVMKQDQALVEKEPKDAVSGK